MRLIGKYLAGLGIFSSGVAVGSSLPQFLNDSQGHSSLESSLKRVYRSFEEPKSIMRDIADDRRGARSLLPPQERMKLYNMPQQDVDSLIERVSEEQQQAEHEFCRRLHLPI